MLNFIKNLFSSMPSFSLGAFESPKDLRNVALASFQAPVKLPDEYETELFSPRNQGGIPKCVGAGIRKIKELYIFIKTGEWVELSDDDLYNQCKAEDGIPDSPGTFPSIGAKLACKVGIASLSAYNSNDPETINKSRAKNKLGGYAYVFADYESVCQAIYKNKAITVSFAVDTNWYYGIIAKVFNLIGRHYVVLHGFRRQYGTVLGQNSWGNEWIGRVAGFFNPALKPGHFEMLWSDYATDNAMDIIAFVDIPPEIIEHIETINYYFNKGMRWGDTGFDILQLQKRLDKDGYWDKLVPFYERYGNATVKAVKRFQEAHGISSDGVVVGPLTLKALNGTRKLTLLEAKIKVESNGNDYAVGDKNLKDHAYGCLQIRQGVVDTVNATLGTKYKSQDCLGNRDLSIKIWNTYWKVYPEFTSDRDKALAWNGGPGWKQRYGKPEYERYTKALDTYWSKISNAMS